ncbi:MAG: hypothetical protein Q8K66_13515 [Sediminibacterium sp.]|nr:hypothetical protein [Sediminibacterium sp.]MDP3129205.1 hypothetical protein [Sediminibacterium sp.]
MWSFEMFNILATTFNPSTRAFMMLCDQYSKQQIDKEQIIPSDRQINYQEFTIKAVCEKCNSGWMSLLEENVKKIFVRLNEGVLFESLTVEESMDLSLWAIIKLIFISKAIEVSYEFDESLLILLRNKIIPEGFIVEVDLLTNTGINFQVSSIDTLTPMNITLEEVHMAEDNSFVGGLHFGNYGFRVSYLRTSISVQRMQMIKKLHLLHPYHGALPFIKGISHFDSSELDWTGEMQLLCSRLRLSDHYDPESKMESYEEFAAKPSLTL